MNGGDLLSPSLTATRDFWDSSRAEREREEDDE